MTFVRGARGALIAAIAWGAFAFGAVYPWGYWPLASVSVLIGLAGLTSHASLPRVEPRSIAVCLLTFVVGCALQLVPLPLAWLSRVSPNTPGLVAALDTAFAFGLADRHPLSIAPFATATALFVILSLVIFLLGATRLMSIAGTRTIVAGIAVIGVLLAVAGIVQQALYRGSYNGRLFGFWRTDFVSSPFGPFANHNHFAGWMVMAIPVTLGMLAGRVAQTVPHLRPGSHARIAWLGSPEASQIVLLGAAALVMSLALVMTMGRSGMIALALAVAIVAGAALRHTVSRRHRLLAIGAVVLLVVAVLAMIGPGLVVATFRNTDWADFNRRRGPWLDALSVIRAFPLTGTGLNTYGLAMLVYQRHALDLHYAQAHNDYLQLAAEGGAMLVVPLAAAVAALGFAVRRRLIEDIYDTTRWVRIGAVAGLIGIALQESVEFSLQMPGNAFLFAVLCAIALHRGPRPAVRRAAIAA